MSRHISVRIRADQKEWLESKGNASEIIRAALDAYREKFEEPIEQGVDIFWIQRRIQDLDLKIENLFADNLYKMASWNLRSIDEPYNHEPTRTPGVRGKAKFRMRNLDAPPSSSGIILLEGSEELKPLLDRSQRIVEVFEKKINELKVEKRRLEEQLSHV